MENEKRLIDANALKEKIWYGNSDPIVKRQYASELVDNAPTVDAVEVVHGKWVDNGIPESMLSLCSVCGFTCGAYTFNYCPNCGAKMDGDGNG